MTTNRQALLIIGMHRSGTSALARTISLLGADLPRHVLVASTGNELGHWEPAPIVSLHDDMLISAGSEWSSLFSLGGDWAESPAATHYMDTIARLLVEEFGNSPFFVLKDPRLTFFVPLWCHVLDRLRIDASPDISHTV